MALVVTIPKTAVKMESDEWRQRRTKSNGRRMNYPKRNARKTTENLSQPSSDEFDNCGAQLVAESLQGCKETAARALFLRTSALSL
ncbi:MAG TPA: hypothetical protein VF944_12065 [Candidatus Bathyarchaeia archaeon]